MKRSPIRKQSKKRIAYRASKAGKDALAHMGRVKELPCVCCGAHPPNEAHHCRSDGMSRDDMKVIPLCYECHRGQYGYHLSPKSWHDDHGPDYGFLGYVWETLYGTRLEEPKA